MDVSPPACRPAPPRWRPTPLLLASGVLHAGALAVLLYQPHWWPWVLGAVLCDHGLLMAIGLTPRSSALGSNWTRLPAVSRTRGQVAITLDDGPDPEVTPRVLHILAEHGARATFFCIGERASRYPALLRDCVRAGHAIENHSFRHRVLFALLGPRALARDLRQAQETILRLSGVAPRFFRAPAGLRSPLLDPVLRRLGLQLATWTRRGFDTVSADADRVLARLTRRLRAGDILLLHDGHAARGPSGEPVVFEVLPRLLAHLHSRGLQPVTLREILTASGTAPPDEARSPAA